MEEADKKHCVGCSHADAHVRDGGQTQRAFA